MTEREVAHLIAALLPPGSSLADADRRAIVRDAGGNPLLVTELTRPVTIDAPRHAGGMADVLARRLETLPPESRAFLDTLVVCGRPVLAARVFEACGLSGDERPLVARLQAAHLARKVACRPSLKVERNNWTLSSPKIRSRCASVARTVSRRSYARIPTCSAVAEYQTSTSVESAAATPSTGVNWEKPVRMAAWPHIGSSSWPSTVTSPANLGGRTSTLPSLP
jgi:hypothetical protein